MCKVNIGIEFLHLKQACSPICIRVQPKHKIAAGGGDAFCSEVTYSK